MAARLSSTGISHHSLLPHILSIRLSTVNSSPHPRIVSQSLNSSSQPRCLTGDLRPCPGYVWLWQELSDPFRLPQISCFPLSLLWLRQLPQRGAWTPGGSVPPPAEGRSNPTDTPVFPPSSFILLSFAWFWIFFLLIALSCCFACTSVSDGVFLMYPWRERYSTSTYSSSILFSWSCYIFHSVESQHTVILTSQLVMETRDDRSIWRDRGPKLLTS